jgi:hypothetical protein
MKFVRGVLAVDQRADDHGKTHGDSTVLSKSSFIRRA